MSKLLPYKALTCCLHDRWFGRGGPEKRRANQSNEDFPQDHVRRRKLQHEVLRINCGRRRCHHAEVDLEHFENPGSDVSDMKRWKRWYG